MSYRRTFLFLIMLTSAVLAFSQRVKTVEAEYVYYAPENVTVEEAKRTALERARIQAIADAFGTVVTQNSSTIISNHNENSDSRFFSSGNTSVKGEWIETIGKPEYKINHNDNLLVVECRVKGKIREIVAPSLDITAKVLKNGTSLKYESTDFRNGDSLYLFFQSSRDGHISVYLRENEEVYQLLPYRAMEKGGYPVVKDKSYVFFSQQDSSAEEVDEYLLYADNEFDIADIIIFYTPELSGNPRAKNRHHDEPLKLDSDSFNKWLVDKRNKEIYSKLIEIPITIKKQ